MSTTMLPIAADDIIETQTLCLAGDAALLPA